MFIRLLCLLNAIFESVVVAMNMFCLETTSQEHADTLHNIILFWIIRMFLAGNFQYGRNGLVVIFQNMPNIVGNVLIDQHNGNIFAAGKTVKGLLHLLQFGVGLDNQKVGLVCRAMTNACQNESCDSVLSFQSPVYPL